MNAAAALVGKTKEFAKRMFRGSEGHATKLRASKLQSN
jgi:hypothetical protein